MTCACQPQLKDGDEMSFGEAIETYGFKEASRMLGEAFKRKRTRKPKD